MSTRSIRISLLTILMVLISIWIFPKHGAASLAGGEEQFQFLIGEIVLGIVYYVCALYAIWSNKTQLLKAITFTYFATLILVVFFLGFRYMG